MKWFAKNWFLLGLIALALFAIPGIVLVILRLFHLDGGINDWLLRNFQVSYELRLAPALTLILLLLPIVLVILYFLKLKRKPLQVPSTFLWKKSIEDLHVNSLFQWLRHNVLLLLQLLVLLFLVYSVLGLRVHGSTTKTQHYILLIDNSASMAIKDVAPTRLDWAKAEALKEIDAAEASDVGMVIVFNSKATTLQAYTNDKEKLRAAVRSIQPTQRPTRIEEALALAESLANPVRSTEDLSSQPDEVPDDQRRTFVQARGISTVVHVYSDGRFAKLSDAALAGLNLRMAKDDPSQGGLNMRYHMAGKKGDPGHSNNLAVVGFNVMRQPSAKKTDAQQLIAFVRLANFRSSKTAVRVKLDIYVEGELRHSLQQARELKARKYVPAAGDDEEIDEPGEEGVRFDLPPIEPRRGVAMHAYLDRPGDDFPLDDQAWLVVGTTRKAKVLIVAKNKNAFLDAFFEQDGTKKIAVAEWLEPEALKTDAYRKKARSSEVDLVIFDRCAPDDEADMPLANTFFIDQPPPPWKRGNKVLKNPLFMPSKLNHPLLKYLTTIGDVRTQEAFIFDVTKNLAAKPEADAKPRTPPTIERIIEASNQTPLLFTLARGPHTDLVQTFPLTSDDGGLPSDWGLQVSFPLFFRNLLYILGNVDDSVRSISVQPGEPVVLRPEAGFRSLHLTTPGKQTLTIPRGERTEIVYADTEGVGIYRYRVGADDAERDKAFAQEPMRGFAVNLLDVNESNIEPRSSIRIGDERIPAGEEKFQTREIWKWILLVVVLLLIAEWFIYQRRIAV